MSDDRDERPKLSFSELDRRRRGEKVGRDEPRGGRAEQEQARVRTQSLHEADSVFSMGKGGAEGKRLANQMRDTHGTTDFLHACRSYCEEIGVPQDPLLLGLLLDTGERDLVVAALETLLEAKNDRSLEIGSGLRSQLRLLEQDRDDTIAGISEELLED
jgi:hypothetical protein